jgi:hypothetical protein
MNNNFYSNTNNLYNQLNKIINETNKIVGKKIEGSDILIDNEQFMKIHTGDDDDNLLNVSGFLINDKGLLFTVNNNKPPFSICELIYILELHKDSNKNVYIYNNNKYKIIRDVWVGSYINTAIVVFETV